MRYRIAMTIEVEAAGELQARESALKLKELIKDPLVRMAIEGAGIRLSADGQPIVYQPQRTA